MFYCYFNKIKNTELGIQVIKRPNIPVASYEYETINVQGGKTLYRKLYLNDIDIEVEFGFVVDDSDSWNDSFRKAKKWINNIKDNKLIFSDDLDFYYSVKLAKITTSERALRKMGRFTVTFTCEGYQYLVDGAEPIKLQSELYNEFEVAQPIYIITGEGKLSMKINGKTIKAQVGQNLTIDTKLGICYRKDGTINNIALTGNYEDMWLQEGENYFTLPSGFQIQIIPNWRCW